VVQAANICEIICESKAIQAHLTTIVDEEDLSVPVTTTKGQNSFSGDYDIAMRLAQIAEENDWIEEIVILYFGDYDFYCGRIREYLEYALEQFSETGEIRVPVEVRLVAVTPEQVKTIKLAGSQLEAFMTTEKRLKQFKKLVVDAVAECWDQTIYDDNTPDEDYDYKANNEEEPESIDPDNDLYDDPENLKRKHPLTIRDKMGEMGTEAFFPRRERSTADRRRKELEEEERVQQRIRELEKQVEQEQEEDNKAEDGAAKK
jgi:CRISPR/Cas system-associated endonuclease Cas1